MKNIRKKLLSIQVSLITAIAIRVEILRGRFRKNELIDPCVTHERICEVEKFDIEFDAEIESPRESILERVDREMIEYAQEGVRGVHLLFKNIKFIGAALAKRTDIIALILEQYYISDRINTEPQNPFAGYNPMNTSFSNAFKDDDNNNNNSGTFDGFM